MSVWDNIFTLCDNPVFSQRDTSRKLSKIICILEAFLYNLLCFYNVLDVICSRFPETYLKTEQYTLRYNTIS